MEWLEAISCAGGKLRPIFLSADGGRRSGELAEADLYRGQALGARKKLPFELKELAVCDSVSYLSAIGFPHALAAGHPVYRLDREGVSYFFPSLVLMMGLLGPMKATGGPLLRPGSLDSFAVPNFLEEEPSIRIPFGSNFRGHRDRCAKRERLLWLTCYPSARRFWDSVYLNACRGVLDCALPSASVEATVTGIRRGKQHFVLRLFVGSLTPSEDPLAFASPLGRRSYSFNRTRFHNPDTTHLHRDAKFRRRSNAIRDSEILPGPNGWALSDAEWVAVRPLLLFPHRDYLPPSTRGKIDRILAKFGSGTGWRRPGVPVGDHIRYYYFLVRAVKWDAFRDAIAGLRSATRADKNGGTEVRSLLLPSEGDLL